MYEADFRDSFNSRIKNLYAAASRCFNLMLNLKRENYVYKCEIGIREALLARVAII